MSLNVSFDRMPRVPNEPWSIWKSRRCSLSGVQTNTSPLAATSSYARHVSWNPPYLNDIDSSEHPATAPLTVMVRSSGTMMGTRPQGSVASTGR